MTRYDVDKHPSRTLADFVAATPNDVMPDEVIARCGRLVLDWIGVTAFAGHHAENADAVRAAADKLDAGAGATVVGQAHTHSPLYAALLNGCFAHSMDFDDTNINRRRRHTPRGAGGCRRTRRRRAPRCRHGRLLRRGRLRI